MSIVTEEAAPPEHGSSPAETDLRSLDPSVRTIWFVRLLLWVALAAAGAFLYELFHVFDPERLLPFGVLTGLALLVGLPLSFVLPRLQYRYWRFALRSDELYLQHGVLNRVRTVVPLRRIQHLDVSQNVLEREFDLGKLIVHTAGTRSSTVTLPGLPIDEAERLRDVIRSYILNREEEAF